MTLSDQIVSIIEREGRLPTKVIADRVGCRPGYVRAVYSRNIELGEVARERDRQNSARWRKENTERHRHSVSRCYYRRRYGVDIGPWTG